MSLQKCDICRSYYDDVQRHHCGGLRSSDWARFLRSLRQWMATDNHARFEIYYLHRDEPLHDEDSADEYSADEDSAA